MTFWGKIVGALFGLMLGGPIGAALGIYLGHKFDKAFEKLRTGGGNFNQQQQHREQQNVYFYATFAVMGHIAKAKGQVTESEIRLATILMDRMGYHGKERQQAQEAFRRGKESSFQLERTLQDLRRVCHGRFDLLQFFLEVQIQAAYADGAIHPRELDVLYIVADQLGFSARQLEDKIAAHENSFNFFQQNGYNQSSDEDYQQSSSYRSYSSGDDLKNAFKL